MNNAATRMLAARSALVLDQPFFGFLSLRLNMIEDLDCDTCWVDGRTLGYNPDFIMGLSGAHTLTSVAHEVIHCAGGHPWRRGIREPELWNEACDYAVNLILLDARFKLPEGVLLDLKYRGKSPEWIYDRLLEQRRQQAAKSKADKGEADKPEPNSGKGTDGESQDDGESESNSDQQADDSDNQTESQSEPQGGKPKASKPQLGEVRDAPPDGSRDGATEAEWKAAVQRAATAADAAGKLPGSLRGFVQATAKPRLDVKSLLLRFVQETTQADYTWTHPNRRYLSQGLFLLSLHSKGMGVMLVGIDTSGSIDNVLLQQFGAILQDVADEMQPRELHVVYCDSMVQRHDKFERGDEIKMQPDGGGGTNFEPVFDLAETLEEQPVCIVYLTDLDGTFPRTVPSIPTMWVSTAERPVPFGEVVLID